MAGQNVLEFTDDNFRSQVLDADQPVLVDLWADWCMPCRALAPTIEQLADDYAGRVRVGKLDTDANRAVATQLNIAAIPTVILFQGGEVIRKFVGVAPIDEFAAELDKVVAS